MTRQFSCLAVVSAVLLAGVGCRPQQPFYFSPPGNLSRYVGLAQNIEYPDVETASLDEVNGAKAPLTLDNPKPENYWDATLEEAIQITLKNSTVLRSLGGVQFGPTGAQGSPSSLLSSPATAATIFIPGQIEADPRYGVEAALAAFDAQLSSSIYWEKNVVPQNTAGTSAVFRPNPYLDDVGNANVTISKYAGTGDQFSVVHDMKYNMDNTPMFWPDASSPFKLWPNDYTTDVLFELRHPFLQGAGVGFNRIAGPGAAVGQANGVVIARLRTDQSLADFEAAVRNLASDVEKAYWNLYYAYRRLDSVVAGRDAALQTWRQAKARFDVGGKGGGAQDEAQARENYLLFKSNVESAQSNLYKTENLLRYMMGLTHSDGRLIRPADEPTKAKVEFDWVDAHAEALTRAVEIRKQKWVVKQKEMELVAAKNYLMPRLDGVARYGWYGIGDTLFDSRLDAGTFNLPHSAYGSLASGDFPTWHLGVDFKMPIGFRREMAGVRYAQLSVTRERKVLQEQELELSHQLADAFRDLSQHYTLSQTNYNRWLAADNEVKAVDAAYKAGTTTLDQVLDAQRRKAEAENEYYRTLVDYNLSISMLHFRKGSLLEYDGVFLAEGPWPAKAYYDARRRARHRDASHFINYGFTQPRIVSQGPYNQGVGGMAPEGEVPAEAPLPVEQPRALGPETIGTPSPVPMDQLPASSVLQGPKGETSSATPRPGPGGQSVRVVPTVKLGQNGDSAGKGYDLAATNLRAIAAKAPPAPSGTTAGTASQVSAASYQQAAQAPAPAATGTSGMWRSTLRSTKTNEPVANPPPAASDSTTSGWKNAQY